MIDAVQSRVMARSRAWPELAWPEWRETLETLHLWMQVVGKIRLVLATRVNHWWHVTLYPTCQGLTTSPMPHGDRLLQIDFDFTDHRLILQTHDGLRETFPLELMPVADFYAGVMTRMERLDMPVTLNTTPTEIPNPIPFERDYRHATYDAAATSRFRDVLLQATRVFQTFRSRFLGKVSPVHFFWGGFDLAVTRFSGRIAPRHTSVPDIPDEVVQTAYSHEVSSCGFWPGGPMLPEPVFYAYAYPSPPGFSEAGVDPADAYFHPTLGEFILPYEAVRRADDPGQILLTFLQSTYEATARLGDWNRSELEAVSLTI